MTVYFASLPFGRGGRNRTRANGFGDHCTTTIRRPYLIDYFIIIAGKGMGKLILWSPLAGLNCRPHPYHGCALPTELSGREVTSTFTIQQEHGGDSLLRFAKQKASFAYCTPSG